MNDVFHVLYLTLQGISQSVIDVFFLMTAVVVFMTVFRFGQFDALKRISIRKAGEITVEMLVQGLVIGLVFSGFVVFLGLPMVFSEYLYFLLPMSFIIGFYHVRFTSLIYAATMMSIIGLFLNGGQIGTIEIPDIAFSVSGIALVTGGLMVLIAVVLAVTGTNHLQPIVATKDHHVVLGFAQQRIWAVPLVLLVAVGQLIAGENVPMPGWWPMLHLADLIPSETSMFVLPLLFVLNHGSISFGYTPKRHIRLQVLLQASAGVTLLVVGLVGDMVGGMDILIVMVMLVTGIVPEILWNYLEGDTRFLYKMDHKGVYIGRVGGGTLAKSLGFLPGDRITQVDGHNIEDLKDLEVLYRDSGVQRVLSVERVEEGTLTIDVQGFDIIELEFGLGLLPHHVSRIYEYEDVTQMNMMHLIRYIQKRDDPEM